MSDDIKPTDADLDRDLRADLAVAEAATPGPWNSALRIDRTPDDADVFVPRPPHGGGDSVLTLSPHSGLPRFKRNEDAHAVGLMRVAWPAAARRALAAEAEVERLGGILGDLTLLAGHLAVTDGDTTATLGWWVRHALTAPARRDGVEVTDDDGEAD